jgi:drug/metabolite transporter (DMT)-like permease
MTLARAGAARLRGVFVDASAGAVAVAAHGVGGTALPASPSIVLMVLLCAVVGAVASSPAEIHRRPPVVRVYVLAAQLVGHCTWVFVSTHTHANHWSVQMVASHVVAAFICAAALICTLSDYSVLSPVSSGT